MPLVWSDWSPLGGGLIGGLAAVLATGGRLVVFGRRDDNEVYHRWQLSQGDGWTGWVSLGAPPWGCTSDPSATLTANGGLVVFVKGVDNAVWRRWQGQPDGNWSDWESLGGVCNSGPAAVLATGGRLVVFVRGTDNSIWHRRQLSPIWPLWSSWVRLPYGSPSDGDLGSAMYPSGGLVVFERATNGLITRRYQTTGDGVWYGGDDVPGSGPSLGGPDAVTGGSGQGAILAVRDSDNGVRINQQRID
jgi:hypothetical protein